MVSGIEFDWDARNTRHLKRHRVTPSEFEELMAGEPVYLEYQTRQGEERYKVLGATKDGRIVIAVWMLRAGKVRTITAYHANRVHQKLYGETRR